MTISAITRPRSISVDRKPLGSREKTFLIEKIEKIAEQKLMFITSMTMCRFIRDFTRDNCKESALKAGAIALYASLLGAGFFTITSSFVLIKTADYSAPLSSDVEARVNFANTFTNVGALFACITDLPAITYVLYQFLLKRPYMEVKQQIWKESYCICMDTKVDRSVREEVYQWHIRNLLKLGARDFYLYPDVKAPTGALHAELSKRLVKIEGEIDRTTSWWQQSKSLLGRCFSRFRGDSCTKKTAKAAASAIFVGTWTLASLLLLESVILLKDTPLGDLFGGSIDDQTNEAFYITQLGCGFSSFTAFGSAAYGAYLLFVRSERQALMRERIAAAFAKYGDKLSQPLKQALNQIQESLDLAVQEKL